MLQMNCQSCGGLIKSPHLAEVQLFVCPLCKDIVVVNDVVIAEQTSSSPLRSALKNLLLSARDKFRSYRSQNQASENQLIINKRLAILLKREDFRLNIAYDLLVQVKFDDDRRSARLLNMSSTGAAVEFFDTGQRPEDHGEVGLHFTLPGQSDPLSLTCRVVWSRRTAEAPQPATVIMGMQFKELDEQTRQRLWDFIVDAETVGPA